MGDGIIAHVHDVKSKLPASDIRFQRVKEEQEKDFACQLFTRWCVEGWPIKHNVDQTCKEFWQYQADISMNAGFLIKGSRMIVP